MPDLNRAKFWMLRVIRSALLLIPGALACGQTQHTAELGDFPLESGEVIRNCRIGYRTAGKLNDARSNAVLVTTWFQGTSRQLAAQIGPGKLVDTSKYHVILVDALGNGVSSSPSNSAEQPNESFPIFSVRDIVETEYELLTRHLNLTHLKAVVGISMGGMQVFQWITQHSGFMDKGISIVGSPQSQADDRARWEEGIKAAQSGDRWQRAFRALGRAAPLAAFAEFGVHSHDYVRQAQAVMSLDVSRSFDGSMKTAANAVRASLLVVGTRADREVNNEPAFEFGRLSGAEVFELNGRCGHQAPSCERATLWPRVARFLAQ